MEQALVRNEITIDKLSQMLAEQAHNAFVYMKYPLWPQYIPDEQRHRANSDIKDATPTISLFNYCRMYPTACHTSRVVLYCSAISDFLGFSNPQARSYRDVLVSAAENHDGQKSGLRDIAEKTKDFTKEDAIRMREHVMQIRRYQDKEKSNVIATHHKWQREGYAPDITLTPEEEVCSKLLALADWHDSAYTRPDRKTGQMLTREQLKDAILEEYGSLQIKYRGDKMPRLFITGKELIPELFDANIFGRFDRYYPFSEPFSFIWQPTQKEINEEINIAQKYRKLVDKQKDKAWKYNKPPKSLFIRFLERLGSMS